MLYICDLKENTNYLDEIYSQNYLLVCPDKINFKRSYCIVIWSRRKKPADLLMFHTINCGPRRKGENDENIGT